MNKVNKITAIALVVSHLFVITTPAYANFLIESDTTENSTEDPDTRLSQWAQSAGTALSSNDQSEALKSLATGQITSAVGSQGEAWLSQFGTARLQLDVDSHGNWSNSSLDFLLPLYETPESMLFTQLGYRAPEGRQTGNLGAGGRIFQGGWMYGANIFLDNDFTGNNRRVGIGAEAWTDYFKLGANSYFGLTDWHQSRDFNDYDERPADGWDIRSEAYLPAYPQLGGRLVYEQYHGDNVALTDKNDRQHNPRAVTTGLSWTPVPLLTAGIDYRTGSGGINDTRFSLAFRYQLGTALSTQLDPNAVSSLRSLAGSRHDLVERNNTIVLDYRKQELIKLSLPSDFTGAAGDKTTLTASVSSKYPVNKIEWNASELLAAGGSISANQTTSAMLILPEWKASGNNTYSISAIAWDVHGNKSNQATTVVRINQSAASILDGNLTVFTDNSLADGKTANVVQAKVTDATGNVLSGQKVAFSASNGATITATTGTTGYDGMARVSLTNTTVGVSEVTAMLNNGVTRSVSTHFTAVATLLDGSMIVTTDNALADGKAMNTVQVKVTDSQGTALAGQKVSFNATNGAKVTVVTGTTGADGLAYASLTNTTDGVSEVTATLDNGVKRSINTHFTTFATLLDGSMVVTADNAPADGKAMNTVQVKVTDSQGTALAGQKVSFNATNGAKVTVVTGTTGADGLAYASLTNTTDGVSEVTATLDNGVKRSINTHFTTFATLLDGSMVVTADNAPADGKATNKVQVKVTDSQGKALAGQSVSFKATNGAKVTVVTGTTGADGLAYANLTSLTDGLVQVTSSLTNGSNQTVSVTFSEVTTQQIESFIVTSDNAFADGMAANAVQAKVTDNHGNPLSGQSVIFTADNGAMVTTLVGITGADGLAKASLTNTMAGITKVTAELKGGSSRFTVAVTFEIAAIISEMTIARDNVLADGSNRMMIVIKVRDYAGNALDGQQVTMSADNGATPEITTLVTSNGLTQSNVTSTTAGAVNITATLSNGNNKTVTGTFLPIATILDGNLTVTTDNAVADGYDTNIVQAKVTDSNGNPLLGQNIVFKVNNGATISRMDGITGSDGIANVSLTNTHAGMVVVTASLDNGTSKFVQTQFISKFTIDSIEAVDKSGGNANNKTFNVSHGPRVLWVGAKFKINTVNAAGNVTWSASNSAVSIAGNVITVNSNPNNITLTGTDDNGKTVSLNMSVITWFEQSGLENEWSIQAGQKCTAQGSVVASKSTLTRLYNEWGNFFVYDGWINSFYQTSTVYDVSKPLGDYNNWALWPDDGSWYKDGWGHLAYACGQ